MSSRPEFYWSEKRQQWRKRFVGSDGKQHDAWGKTKAECRNKVRELEQNAALANKNPANAALFYEYARTWYSLNAPGKSDKMQQWYRTAINKHICPVLGAKPLPEINSDDCKAVMAAVANMSNESQKRILSIMRRIFDSAVAAGYIEKTPAVNLKAAGRRTAEREALTRAQQETLLKSLEGHRCQVFCALGLYAGLRREEILGLKWDCVHLDEKAPYISVRRSLHWKGNKAELVEELKSAASRRDIPIPTPLTNILKYILDSESEYVIHNANNEPLSNSAFRRMWKAVEERSERTVTYSVNGHEYARQLKLGDIAPYTGLPVTIDFDVTPHKLRHTYITELVMAGANIKQVQTLAGHADPNVTLKIYTHIVDKSPAATQSAVLAAFG